jgi:hypothetical protein
MSAATSFAVRYLSIAFTLKLVGASIFH